MYKYKLKDGNSDGERVFPNVGATVNGFIESNEPIESPLLELVVEAAAPVAPAPVVGVASQQNPAQPATATNEQTTNTGEQA